MKNQVVIYNTSATPDGMTIDDVFTYFELTGKLLWQEHIDGLKNHPPQVFNVNLEEDAPTCNCSLIEAVNAAQELYQTGRISQHSLKQIILEIFHVKEEKNVICPSFPPMSECVQCKFPIEVTV